jgi:hypothetical protein
MSSKEEIQRFPSKDRPYRGQLCWGFQCHVGDDGYRIFIESPASEENRGKRGHGEHGPAHVHAYHIVHERMSHFELLESDDGKVRAIPFNKSPSETLSVEQLNQIRPVIEERGAELLQLFRELYVDEPVSGEVTRYGSAADRIERQRSRPWVGKNDHLAKR